MAVRLEDAASIGAALCRDDISSAFAHPSRDKPAPTRVDCKVYIWARFPVRAIFSHHFLDPNGNNP
jgi:hypothetical protein